MKRNRQAEQLGLKLYQEGAQLAEDNANKRHSDWSQSAYKAICMYAQESAEFRVEDVRRWATDNNLVPEPPSRRAWAGPITRAKNAGIVEPAGFIPSSESCGHAQPKRLYRSLVYKAAA